MQRPKWLAIGFVGLVGLGFLFPGAATGRQQYHVEFKAMYPGKKANLDSVKCGVCHETVGANKKRLNEYGTAFGKALGGKNVKDKETIQKALKEAEHYLPN